MDASTWSACNPCKALALTLRDAGLSHWFRQDDGGRHYLMTKAAVQWWHSATAAQVETLRARMYDIDVAGQVAWVDVLRDADVFVYQAPHGMIPREIRRPV